MSTAVRANETIDYFSQVQPIVNRHCSRCHGNEEANGEVNFSEMRTSRDLTANFDVWEKAIGHLEAGTMPPSDEKQPSKRDKTVIIDWYNHRFVKNVEPQPGIFTPRRLCASEYRNTLESILGLKLDVAIMEAEQTVTEKSLVMKLLPTDPPGPSGFRNDTSGNPLTSVIWNQYSYLVDNGLARLFSQQNREALEAYTGEIDNSGLTEQQAKSMLQTFLRRANRREVGPQVIAKYVSPIRSLSGEKLELALRTQLKAILMSPTFLYRGLLMPVKPGVEQPVDDYELAERLSYFIWGDMPDDHLLELAKNARLSDEKTLIDQVSRMLASTKARNLAEDLGVQWFTLQEIEKTSNNPPVAHALTSQPIDFLHYLFTQNARVTELIDSKTTFINPHTAKYYPKDRKQMTPYRKQRGIEVEAVSNQKITLENTPERGGLLTMPGVLAMNKGPVLRGTWILERVLGEELPEPPADVGQVAPDRSGEKLTFRQRFEQHRRNETCAVCHDKIDPLGFALQGYGPGGNLLKAGTAQVSKRELKRGAVTDSNGIDTSGKLPTGEEFANFEELKTLLVTSQREKVTRATVRRIMSYALCRRLEYYDRPAVESIVANLVDNDGTFRDLINGIVVSLPFRKTTGLTEKEQQL